MYVQLKVTRSGQESYSLSAENRYRARVRGGKDFVSFEKDHKEKRNSHTCIFRNIASVTSVRHAPRQVQRPKLGAIPIVARLDWSWLNNVWRRMHPRAARLRGRIVSPWQNAAVITYTIDCLYWLGKQGPRGFMRMRYRRHAYIHVAPHALFLQQ